MSDSHDWTMPRSMPPSPRRWSDGGPGWPPTAPDLIGDMRERLATLEADYRNAGQILGDRAQSHAERMNRIDGRLTEGDHRSTENDRRLSAIEDRARSTETTVQGLDDRLTRIERQRAALMAWGQYLAAALILGLTMSGQIDAGTALKFLFRIMGLPL